MNTLLIFGAGSGVGAELVKLTAQEWPVRTRRSCQRWAAYDFAPMKADPEGIATTTKWKAPLEIGGEYDYPGIAQSLDDLVPAETLLAALQSTANQLTGLKERLAARGIPQQILNMPAISFSFIPEKLRRWGLL
ncbi:hypothetical protein [Rahnella aquatilis]|uniref:hypothetical protein n=1 Tax=Rahnella aquatilis TaxID=34038 RepID=UPI0036671887